MIHCQDGARVRRKAIFQHTPNDTHTGCPVNRLPGSLYLYPQFFVNGSGSEPSASSSVPAVPGQPSSP